MKKYLFGALAFVVIAGYFVVSCSNSQIKDFSVAFYNVENLFDTIDNPQTRDNDHLPTSKVAWNSYRTVSFTGIPKNTSINLTISLKLCLPLTLRCFPLYLV